MKAWVFRSVGALGLAFFLVAAMSCGRDQQLISIAVKPDTETFGDANTPVSANAGSNVQLRALGTYIHPPVTKDITSQVIWVSNTPQMMTVDSTGLLTATGLACGGALVSATVKTNSSAGNRSSSGAIVTGSMNANVVCFTGTGSGGGSGPILTVDFLGTGTGTVVSSPAGLSCSSNPCNASFASGTTVNITATPNGTFAGWNNCDATSGPGLTVCTINSLAANRTVTATFN